MAEDRVISVRLNGHKQYSRPTPQYSHPPTAFTTPQYPSSEDYQLFRTFLAITQGGPSQASAITTTHSGLHGSYTTEQTIDYLLALKKSRTESLRQYASWYWDIFNEIKNCSQYHDVAIQQFKLGLDSASSAFANLILNEPANMDKLMLHINHHSKLDEAITEREKAKKKYFKSGKGGHSRKDEFEGIVTVFKEPLHELLKKIKQEEWFSLAPKNGPKPPARDLKYRCRYHNTKGHLTTWCPQFKAYLEEKVGEGKLADYIDHEKTRAKAKGSKTADDNNDEELIDVQVIHEYADDDVERQLREELKAVNSTKEVMACKPAKQKVEARRRQQMDDNLYRKGSRERTATSL
ncbi:hypothetical protein Vadar_007800 [Vaccinium darrowii]|uniref:Uncharacterized protein n=1 Tax=Vaccinium darrowii TaxID=229202 RepID=A0ACB7X8G3_9ERIC|nr:hypothetical protein Vadar_007800 [Vaccinium darrowii]